MGSPTDLACAQWRKSSYSNEQGECVEVAALQGAQWRKSSYSQDVGECVEVAAVHGAQWRNADGRRPVTASGIVAVRDSKNPDGPALTFAPAAFAAFVRAAATGAV